MEASKKDFFFFYRVILMLRFEGERKVEQAEIINRFEGAENKRNKHFCFIKGDILTESSVSPFHFLLL